MSVHAEWITQGFEDLELSTQRVIREAILRGHAVEVLDRDANFIRIIGNGKVEYVRQATRTSADSYIAPLIMENKKVTKRVLAESGIRVPSGRDYSSARALIDDWPYWEGRGEIVVKPNSTNFGIAVAILKAPFGYAEYAAAGEAAFREDTSVLVEEFIPGREFRFLVIGGLTRAILHRVPANVTGDGCSSIATLVARKNLDPRRGAGYRSPLEKIALGSEEAAFLREQGLTFDSVPEAGHLVYLRKNSNISTGGDSVDFTDTVHPGYGDIAATAAAAVGARICGVDMIVESVEAEPTASNYGIIELNFNPALHIHDFPFEGKNREVEKSVLDLLDL
jgi:glutamate--cysteine ligase